MEGFMNKLSGFAKNAFEKGKDLTQTAVDKSKELSEIAKLNMEISKAKDTIKNTKLQLGEYAYTNGLLKEDEVAGGYITEIDTQLAKIETLKADIEAVKAKSANPEVKAAETEEVFEEAAPVAEVVEAVSEKAAEVVETAEAAVESAAETLSMETEEIVRDITE